MVWLLQELAGPRYQDHLKVFFLNIVKSNIVFGRTECESKINCKLMRRPRWLGPRQIISHTGCLDLPLRTCSYDRAKD